MVAVDTGFPGGPGKTHFEEDFTSLMDDLEHKIFDAFGDDIVVHPGHGDDTTVGVERPHLAEWRNRGCRPRGLIRTDRIGAWRAAVDWV